jgi:hypothetical protein
MLILGWVEVYDKYKTALVSDPHHRITLVELKVMCPKKHENIILQFVLTKKYGVKISQVTALTHICDPPAQNQAKVAFLITE